MSERTTIIVVALTEIERFMLEKLLPQIPDILEGTEKEISGSRRIIDGILAKIRIKEDEK